MRRCSISATLAAALSFAAVLWCVFSCTPERPEFDYDLMSTERGYSGHSDFSTAGEYSRVMLFYFAGHNSLSTYIADDIADLENGYIPRSSKDVILVFSHLPKKHGAYSDSPSPVLYRLSSDAFGKPKRDTLKVYPEGTIAASPETMNEVLSFVSKRFPSLHYGMLFSSHASGWVPAGYYNNPAPYEGSSITWLRQRRRAMPYFELPYDPSMPAVRSIGQDVVSQKTSTSSVMYEIDLKEFAAAIPLHLDYLIFDACLMGCVEVAYELRDVCDLIQFSPAEVLAEGNDYTTITSHLFAPGGTDVEGVAKDYFEYYDKQSDFYRAATITVFDCTAAGKFFDLSGSLISKYHDSIMSVKPDMVQGYYRFGRCYFYDMEDILVKAGISESEKAAFEAALDECVPYRAATPSFLEFKINTYSGLSMYLPSISTYYTGKDFTYLNSFYKSGVSWNDITHLVP